MTDSVGNGRDREGAAGSATSRVADVVTRIGAAYEDSVETAKTAAADVGAAVKSQAAQAARDAKTTVSALAEEARLHVNDIVDEQKSIGADRLAGVARAIQAAASDLDRTSPELARLAATAARRIEDLADDVRANSLADLLGAVSDFGRRRPVAFIGLALAAGFLTARFIKSTAAPSDRDMGSASA